MSNGDLFNNWHIIPRDIKYKRIHVSSPFAMSTLRDTFAVFVLEEKHTR